LKYVFQFCSDNGAQLAEITDGFVMKEVKTFIDKLDPRGNHLYWIGLTAEQNEGDFVWSSTNESVTFTDWNEGEPNNNRGHENCVHLELGRLNRRWNDRQCNSSFLFALCQKGYFLLILYLSLDVQLLI
jgi:hypothetical protein